VKEQVRVLLNGHLSRFKVTWEAGSSWPFGDLGVAVLPAKSSDLLLLNELAVQYPELKVTKFVERSYSANELANFPWLVLWVRDFLDLEDRSPSEELCVSCRYPIDPMDPGPIPLRSNAFPKSGLATLMVGLSCTVDFLNAGSKRDSLVRR
jgi:hypothetical protein